jgi:hypothetical protein
MNQRLILILILIGGFAVNSMAQQFLVLEKMGTKRRFEFYPGDSFTFKTPDENFFTRVTIQGLSDSLVMLKERNVPFSTIQAIDISEHRNSTFLTRSGPYLMVAGILLLVFDVVNQTVVQGGAYESSTGVLITSGVLIGSGAIFKFGRKNKIKLEKWWRIRYVNI